MPLRVGGAGRIAEGAPFAERCAGHAQAFATACARRPYRRAHAHRRRAKVVAQGTFHDGGGARMACPHMKLCRMVIASQQCRQTKTGGAAAARRLARHCWVWRLAPG